MTEFLIYLAIGLLFELAAGSFILRGIYLWYAPLTPLGPQDWVAPVPVDKGDILDQSGDSPYAPPKSKGTDNRNGDDSTTRLTMGKATLTALVTILIVLAILIIVGNVVANIFDSFGPKLAPFHTVSRIAAGLVVAFFVTSAVFMEILEIPRYRGAMVVAFFWLMGMFLITAGGLFALSRL